MVSLPHPKQSQQRSLRAPPWPANDQEHDGADTQTQPEGGRDAGGAVPRDEDKTAIESTRAIYLAVAGGVALLSVSVLLFQSGASAPDRHFSIQGIIEEVVRTRGVATLDSGHGQFLLQVLAILQIILLVWYANAQHVTAFKLRHGLLDTVIQFLFVVPEFFLILSSDPSDTIKFQVWNFWFAALCLWAIVAYCHLLVALYKPRLDVFICKLRGKRVVVADRFSAVRRRVGTWYFVLAFALISISGVYAVHCSGLVRVELPLEIPASGLASGLIVNALILAFWAMFEVFFQARVNKREQARKPR